MLLNSPEFSNFIVQLFFFSPVKLRAKLRALVGVVGSSTASSVLHPRAPKEAKARQLHLETRGGKAEKEPRLEEH